MTAESMEKHGGRHRRDTLVRRFVQHDIDHVLMLGWVGCTRYTHTPSGVRREVLPPAVTA